MIRVLATVILITGSAAAFTRQSADDVTRADIRPMRSLNTAENAIRQQSGKYLELTSLIDHKMMGGVRAEIETNGTVVFFQGRQLRLLPEPTNLIGRQTRSRVSAGGTSTFALRATADFGSPAPTYFAIFF